MLMGTFTFSPETVSRLGNNADPHVITKKVYGDSFIKLRRRQTLSSRQLSPQTTPDILNEHDADLGSGAPCHSDSNLVIGGGKTGYIVSFGTAIR